MNTPQPALPRRLYVEPTTRCNLRCPMCVKAGDFSMIPDADLDPALLDRLAPDLHACETVIFSGIGEPTLHPALPDMIRRVAKAAPHAVIGVQSNGLCLDLPLLDRLLAAGLSRLCLSADRLDSPEPANHEANHKTVHAFPLGAAHLPASRTGDLLRRIRARVPQRERLELGCQMVLHRENLHELPRMVELAARCGADFMLVSHLLPYHEAACAGSLFRYDTAEAQQFFAQGYAEAQKRGLDLRPYDAVMWRGNWQSEDKKIINTAQTLVREAVERGHPLHIRRLLRLEDDPLAEERAALPGLLAEAARVAEAAGLRLRLPASSATTQRQCPFLEESWAFIDTQGRVSPCHYLWHEYACWPDGELKRVYPLYFGRLDTSSLGEMWNAEDWREFRHDGLSYAFADCFSCNGVCPDTKGKFGPFTVDCHARNVPCGHCPWCHGAVDCLRDF